MRKLLVASHKGGVGKTTTAINLATATALADEGRVLLVDTDPVGSIRAALNLAEPSKTFRDVGSDTELPLWPDVIPNLDVTTAYQNGRPVTGHTLADVVSALLSQLPEQRYAKLIFDSTPMTADRQVKHLLDVADELVLVLRSEPLAFRTLPNFLQLLKSVQQAGSAIRLRGLLLTLPPGEPIGGFWEAEIRRYFQHYILPQSIPFDPEVSRAVLAGRPVLTANPNAPAAIEYHALAQCLGLIAVEEETIDLFDPTSEPESTDPPEQTESAPTPSFEARPPQGWDERSEETTVPLDDPLATPPPGARQPFLDEIPHAPPTMLAKDLFAAKETGGHTGDITAIAFTPDGTGLATASWDKTVKIWDLETGQERVTLKGHRGRISGLCFARGGDQIVTAGWDKTARLWETATGRELRSFEGHKGAVTATCELPEQGAIATTSWDKSIKIWHLASGREVATLTGHQRMATGVASSPNGTIIASGAWDKTVRLWTNEGEPLALLRGHAGDVSAVAFSPDGKWVASAAADKTVRLSKVDPPCEQAVLHGHSGGVQAVAFSPDGARLASAGSDRTVRVWDVLTGEPRLTLHGHDGVINAIAFSPDGSILASCGLDGVVILWDEDGNQLGKLAVHQKAGESVTSTADADADATTALPPMLDAVSEDERPLPVPESPTLTNPEQTADLFSPTNEFGDQLTSMGAAGGADAPKLEADPTARVGSEPELETDPEEVDFGASRSDATAQINHKFDSRNTSESRSHYADAPPGAFTALAVAPNEAVFATPLANGNVLVWNTDERAIRHRLTGHTGEVRAAAFSPDSKCLATAGWDMSIRIWDVMEGTLLNRLTGHLAQVTALAYSPDGRWLASGSWDQSIKLWDLASRGEGPTLYGHSDGISCLAFPKDSPLLVSGSEDATLRVWDISDGGRLIHVLEGHNREIYSVDLSEDGQIGSVDGGGVLKIWDLINGGEEEVSIQAHRRLASSVAFAPEGTLIATGGWDREVVIWHAVTGQERLRFFGHQAGVSGLCFLANGDVLLSAGLDATVRFWNPFSGESLGMLGEGNFDQEESSETPDPSEAGAITEPYSEPHPSVRAEEPEPDEVDSDIIPLTDVIPLDQSVKVNAEPVPEPEPEETTPEPSDVPATLHHKTGTNGLSKSDATPEILLAAAGEQGQIIIWDLIESVEKLNWQGHTADVNAVAFLPGGRHLAAGSSDHTIRLWDLHDCSSQVLEGHSGEVTAVACSPDGSYLASASWDQTVRLWDLGTGQEVRRFPGHRGAVTAVTFSPDGTALATASWDKTVKVWDVSTGRELANLRGHEKMVTAVAFSPDTRTIASGSWDKTAKVWDIESARPIYTLPGHGFAVSTLAFLPDGNALLTGSWDMTVKLWDLTHGDELKSFRGHTESIRSLSLLGDGRTLATGSWDGTVRIWGIELETEQGVLKAPSTRVHTVAFAPMSAPVSSSRSDTEDSVARSF